MKRLAVLGLILALTGCSAAGDTTMSQGVVVTGSGEETSVTVCSLALDGEGRIAAILWDTAEGEGSPSKKQQGDSYGMKGASPIGREWYEQIAALEEYATGKTPEEVAAMALTEGGAPAEEALTSSCTIAVRDHLRALQEAARQTR